MATLNRSAIVVKPKQPFLDWLHTADPTSHELTLRNLVLEPTIYLIPECDTGAEVEQALRELCEEIFSEQLAGWFNDETTWPQDRGFEVFCHWFDFQHHSMLVDLCDDPLILEWTEDFGISLLCENRTIWFWRATATHGVAPDPGTKSCFRHTAAK